MNKLNDVLKNNFNNDFVQKMQNAICMSAFKYGDVSEKQGEKALNRINDEMEAFKADHNLEHLINIANWAMIRYMFPQADEAYTGTDSNKTTRKVYKTVFEHLRDYILEND